MIDWLLDMVGRYWLHAILFFVLRLVIVAHFEGRLVFGSYLILSLLATFYASVYGWFQWQFYLHDKDSRDARARR